MRRGCPTPLQDNGYHPLLWDELRKLRPMRVGIFALRRGIYPPPACDGHYGALDHSWDRVPHGYRSLRYRTVTVITVTIITAL